MSKTKCIVIIGLIVILIIVAFRFSMDAGTAIMELF